MKDQAEIMETLQIKMDMGVSPHPKITTISITLPWTADVRPSLAVSLMIVANMIPEIHLIFLSTLDLATNPQGEIDRLRNQKLEGTINLCIGSHGTTVPNKTSRKIAQNVLTLNQDQDHRLFK
jgi:hypothetical protein